MTIRPTVGIGPSGTPAGKHYYVQSSVKDNCIQFLFHTLCCGKRNSVELNIRLHEIKRVYNQLLTNISENEDFSLIIGSYKMLIQSVFMDEFRERMLAYFESLG
jgi:hypothetical protein